MPTSDEQLLALLGTDSEALEVFYRRHVGKVVAFATRRSPTPEEAADLVAEVFVALIESSERFDPRRGRAVPWMFGIAANLAAGRHRRARREQRAVSRVEGRRLLEADDYEQLEERIDSSRMARRLHAGMANLPEAERAVVELTSLEGLTPTEAAQALGISAANARMRLSRGRRRLRRHLAGVDGGQDPSSSVGGTETTS